MLKNKNKVIEITYKLLIYGIPIISVVSLLLSLYFSPSNYFILGLYLFIPLFFSCLIYVTTKNRFIEIKFIKIKFTIPIILFIISFIMQIILLYLFNIRLYYFYALNATNSILIVIEVLYFKIDDMKKYIILLQIFLNSIVIIFSVTLKYYFFIGRTDSVAHIWFTKNLIINNHITNLFLDYENYPMWYMLNAIIYKISMNNIMVHHSIFITNCIIYVFSLLFIYLIINKLFNNYKISLLSTIFVSLYPNFIYSGMASVPRYLTSLYLLYYIFSTIYLKNIKRDVISSLFMIVIVLTHSVSIFFIMSIIFSLIILEYIYSNNNYKYFNNQKTIIMLTIIFFTYYTIYNNEDIIKILSRAVLTNQQISIKIISNVVYPINEVFNYLSYSIFLFFLVYGVLTIISSKYKVLSKIFSLFSLIIISFSIPGPIYLFKFLISNLMLNRFEEYSFIFISISGVGFYYLFYKSNKYNKIFLLIFLILSFLSISNEFTASDNPLVKRPFYTFYLSKNEINALNTIPKFTKTYLLSDRITSKYLFYSPYQSMTHILEVENDSLKFLRNSKDDLILLRKNELSKRPLSMLSVQGNTFKLNPSWIGSLDYYYNDSPLWRNIDYFNKLYDSKEVIIYH